MGKFNLMNPPANLVDKVQWLIDGQKILFGRTASSTGGGSGSMTIGSPVVSGLANRILFTDSSSNLSQSTNLQYNSIANTFTAPGISTDGIFRQASIGFVTQQSYFYIDDINAISDIIIKGSVLLQLTANNCKLGDISDLGSSTLLDVNDAVQIIYATCDNGFVVQDVAKNTYLVIDVANNTYQIGAIDTSGGTYLFIDDTNKVCISTNAVAYPTYQVITSGSATTISSSVSIVYVDPPSALASATLLCPATPVDGQEVTILFGGAIGGAGVNVVTSLSFQASPPGQALIGTYPTSATTDTVIKIKWRASTSLWYRID